MKLAEILSIVNVSSKTKKLVRLCKIIAGGTFSLVKCCGVGHCLVMALQCLIRFDTSNA